MRLSAGRWKWRPRQRKVLGDRWSLRKRNIFFFFSEKKYLRPFTLVPYFSVWLLNGAIRTCRVNERDDDGRWWRFLMGRRVLVVGVVTWSTKLLSSTLSTVRVVTQQVAQPKAKKKKINKSRHTQSSLFDDLLVRVFLHPSGQGKPTKEKGGLLIIFLHHFQVFCVRSDGGAHLLPSRNKSADDRSMELHCSSQIEKKIRNLGTLNTAPKYLLHQERGDKICRAFRWCKTLQECLLIIYFYFYFIFLCGCIWHQAKHSTVVIFFLGGGKVLWMCGSSSHPSIHPLMLRSGWWTSQFLLHV